MFARRNRCAVFLGSACIVSVKSIMPHSSKTSEAKTFVQWLPENLSVGSREESLELRFCEGKRF